MLDQVPGTYECTHPSLHDDINIRHVPRMIDHRIHRTFNPMMLTLIIVLLPILSSSSSTIKSNTINATFDINKHWSCSDHPKSSDEIIVDFNIPLLPRSQLELLKSFGVPLKWQSYRYQRKPWNYLEFHDKCPGVP